MKATELTQSEKIRLLATQGMGWEVLSIQFSTTYEIYGRKTDRIERDLGPCYFIWNPFTSLDTVAEVEARLTDEQWIEYDCVLRRIVFGYLIPTTRWRETRDLLTASAAQRSEALVEVLNA